MRLINADKFEAFGSKIEDAEMGYTTGYVDGVTSVLEAIDAAPTSMPCRWCGAGTAKKAGPAVSTFIA